MKNYNNVTLVGEVMREVESNNLKFRTAFVLKIDRPYKDDDNKPISDYINIVAWGKLAEVCREYIKKGNIVLVSGRIQSRSYERDNQTAWITEICAESMNILEYSKTK